MDKYMRKHQDQIRGSRSTLPTPHGRAIAPWRELDPMPREPNEQEDRAPATCHFFWQHS